MSNASFLNLEKHVLITNKLENGEVLTVHCKFAEDDLGEHVLHKDENYRISLCLNIFYRTLFLCTFTWSEQVYRFDICDGVGDHCFDCNRRITHSAPYLAQTPFNFDTCYK